MREKPAQNHPARGTKSPKNYQARRYWWFPDGAALWFGAPWRLRAPLLFIVFVRWRFLGNFSVISRRFPSQKSAKEPPPLCFTGRTCWLYRLSPFVFTPRLESLRIKVASGAADHESTLIEWLKWWVSCLERRQFALNDIFLGTNLVQRDDSAVPPLFSVFSAFISCRRVPTSQ